jgi:acetamidase/formamidase
MPITYLLPAERIHYKWDETLEPVLEIESGDVVVVDTRILTEEQLLPGSGPEAVLAIEWERVHALTGPIYIRGAEPGDTLEIVVRRLRTGSWGVSWIDPTYGLLLAHRRAAHDVRTRPVRREPGLQGPRGRSASLPAGLRGGRALLHG